MSAVSLIGTLAAPSSEGTESGRGAADQGSTFGAVLTAAGRLFGQDAADAGASDADGETAQPLDGESADVATDQGASAIAVLLAAQLVSSSPDGAQAPAMSGEPTASESPKPAPLAAGTDAAPAPAPVDGAAPTPDVPAVSLPAPEVARDVAGTEAFSNAGTAATPATASPIALVDEPAPTGATAVPASVMPPASAPASVLPESRPASTAPLAAPLIAVGPDAEQPSTLTARPKAAIPTRVTGDAQAPAGSPAPVTAPASATAERADAAPSATTVTTVSSPAPIPAAAPAPALSEVASSPAAQRAIAAQVTPVVIAIAQRPEGVHQLTMTVNPDSLGPVTVRAQIGQGGDVQVQLLGATDAGREALKAIVADLRRDLAAVMPHAALSIGSGTSADAGADGRGAPSQAGGAAGDPSSGDRSPQRAEAPRPVATAGIDIVPSPSAPALAASGAGLDIFA